jgi:hypothetical protein
MQYKKLYQNVHKRVFVLNVSFFVTFPIIKNLY